MVSESGGRPGRWVPSRADQLQRHRRLSERVAEVTVSGGRFRQVACHGGAQPGRPIRRLLASVQSESTPTRGVVSEDERHASHHHSAGERSVSRQGIGHGPRRRRGRIHDPARDDRPLPVPPRRRTSRSATGRTPRSVSLRPSEPYAKNRRPKADRHRTPADGRDFRRTAANARPQTGDSGQSMPTPNAGIFGYLRWVIR